MITRQALVDYCDDYLQASQFKDYCPNGLQVEGRAEIRNIVTGVTASLALVEKALDANADAILVHHGYFWKSEGPAIVRDKKARLQTLLANDINLLVYHLPLDCHRDLGNNQQLGQVLGLRVDAVHAVNGIEGLLWQGSLSSPMTPSAFARQINLRLQREPLHIAPSQPEMISSVAWCTGAAQHYIHVAADLGVDAYISGEISESTFHCAHELNIHYFAAGHHATERYGIKALGEHVAQACGIEHEFIDIPSPV